MTSIVRGGSNIETIQEARKVAAKNPGNEAIVQNEKGKFDVYALSKKDSNHVNKREFDSFKDNSVVEFSMAKKGKADERVAIPGVSGQASAVATVAQPTRSATTVAPQANAAAAGRPVATATNNTRTATAPSPRTVAAPAASAPAAPSSRGIDLSNYDAKEGARLAKVASRSAHRHSGGECYHYVKAALSKIGIHIEGEDAYQATGELLRKYPNKFQKVEGLTNADLAKLPAGAIVVWGQSPDARLRERGKGWESGHISIADGKGGEISDFRGPQNEHHYANGGFTVFLPKKP